MNGLSMPSVIALANGLLPTNISGSSSTSSACPASVSNRWSRGNWRSSTRTAEAEVDQPVAALVEEPRQGLEDRVEALELAQRDQRAAVGRVLPGAGADAGEGGSCRAGSVVGRHAPERRGRCSRRSFHHCGSRPMNPSSRVCTSASAGTSTLGPYWPLPGAAPPSAPCPASIAAQRSGSRRVVLAGRPGEVPGVHEDVGGEEPRHRLRQRDVADVRVAQHPRRRGRVVEQRLHLAWRSCQAADGVVVDRRSARRAARRPPTPGTTGTTRRGAAPRRGRSSPRPVPGRPTTPGSPRRPGRRSRRRSGGTPRPGVSHARSDPFTGARSETHRRRAGSAAVRRS